MAKLHHFVLENACYHTVSATYRRMPLFSDETAARIVLGALGFIRQKRAFVLAFCLLPDHLHLVVVPKTPFTLAQVMQSIKGYTSRAIHQKDGARGRLWQQGYYDRVIRDEEHLRLTIEYVHENAVTTGLAQQPEDYPYSSAHPGMDADFDAWLDGGRG